jgi:hypothetical protein
MFHIQKSQEILNGDIVSSDTTHQVEEIEKYFVDEKKCFLAFETPIQLIGNDRVYALRGGRGGGGDREQYINSRGELDGDTCMTF